MGSAIVAQETLELPYEQQCQLENFVGTGPFTVTDVVPEQEYTLAVREDYDWAPASLEHQGRAYLDEIQVIVTPEDSVRIGALTSGQGDAIRTVQAYDEPGLEDKGFTVLAPQTNGVNPQLALRFTNPLLADLDVRRALQLATDPAEIVETLFSDNYKPATSVLSSGRDRLRRPLRQAGLRSGCRERAARRGRLGRRRRRHPREGRRAPVVHDVRRAPSSPSRSRRTRSSPSSGRRSASS